jgi:hypothetical protein
MLERQESHKIVRWRLFITNTSSQGDIFSIHRITPLLPPAEAIEIMEVLTEYSAKNTLHATLQAANECETIGDLRFFDFSKLPSNQMAYPQFFTQLDLLNRV